MIQTRLVDYRDEGQRLQAFIAWDERLAGLRPAVPVAHPIRGRSELESCLAELFA